MTSDAYWGSFLYTGVLQTAFGYPFEVLKSRCQRQEHKYIIVKDVKHIYSRYGVYGFYRHCQFPLVISTVVNELLFHQYFVLRHEYKFGSFVSGGCAGFFTSFLLQPFEVMKTFRQCECSLTWEKLWTSGYWQRGWIYLSVRECIGGATYFGMYTHCHEELEWSVWTSGGCAGVSSWIISYPFDHFKTQSYFQSKINKYNFGVGLLCMIVRSWLVNSCIFSSMNL